MGQRLHTRRGVHGPPSRVGELSLWGHSGDTFSQAPWRMQEGPEDASGRLWFPQIGRAPCAGRGLRGPHRGSRACGRGWGRAWMGHRWSRCKENTFGRHEGDIFILTTKAESRSERRKSRQPPREKSAPNKQWDRNAQPLHLETRQAGSSQRLPLTHPSEAQGVPSPGHRRRVLPGSRDGRDRKSGSGSPTSTRGCSSTGGGSPPGPGTSWTDLLARPGLAP